MNQNNLTTGSENNQLTLLVDNVKMEPHAKMRGGTIEKGFYITVSQYNLEDLLCQMLEDYGEAVLISRIQKL